MPTKPRHSSLSRATAAGLIAGVLAAAGCGEPQTIEERNTAQPGEIDAPLPQTANGAGRPEERVAQTEAERGGADEQVSRPANPGQTTARAVLEPTGDYVANGTVRFVPQEGGEMMVVVNVRGLEPGPHGIHLHENGDCSAPDASSAGEHFAPEDDPHGSPEDPPSAHHAGDLGNVNADDAGAAEARFVDPELELEGEFGVVGRAVIVHADADDLETQPDGDSGDRVACGVVRPVQGTANSARG